MMSDMRTTTVREVQHRLAAILSEVEAGQEIVITRRGKVVARLVPPRDSGPAVPWPDAGERMRRIFPDGPPGGSPPSDIIDEQRGERL